MKQFFLITPGSQKCIFKAGIKHPNKALNNTKTAISVMFSASASGEIFPPYVVTKLTIYGQIGVPMVLTETDIIERNPVGLMRIRLKIGLFP